MGKTLDDVIDSCQKYGLVVTDENKELFLGFLQRQIKREIKEDYGFDIDFKIIGSHYPYLFLNIIIDKLLLFSYLVGQTPIIVLYDRGTGKKRIIDVKDLYLLRFSQSGANGERRDKLSAIIKTDERQRKLFARIKSRKAHFKKRHNIDTKDLREHINELGQDEAVIKYFGCVISYETKKTLEEVINICQERHELVVTNQNREIYLAFLQRQARIEKRSNPRFDLNFRTNSNKSPHLFLNILVDKLLLFSYLIGQTPIIAGYKGNTKKRRMKSVKDLYLLRFSEIGCSSSSNDDAQKRQKIIEFKTTDKTLYYLATRIQQRKRELKRRYRFNAMNWREHIDELGRDKTVVAHYGCVINYQMVKQCPSPNPFTHGHGGYRHGKRSPTTPIKQQLPFLKHKL